MARDLLEPILDGGIQNPHYFEGRLLTAEALRADQNAHRARQRRLGRAAGAGVVHGLWVTIESTGGGDTPPVLAVTGGLAINGKGETLEITTREAIALTRAPKTPGSTPCLFHDCLPPSVGLEATGEGFYVLVLSPVAGYRERAPMSGLSEPRAGAGCGSRWAVEGVQLRLEPFDPLAASGVSDATRDLLADELLGATGEAVRSRLRNVLAHLCLGTEQLAGFAADPFARALVPGGGGATRPALAAYGALDDLVAAGRLTACDVPLALLDWRLDGLAWLDNWAVRRRPAPPPTAEPFPTLSAGRRRAEAEAAFFQFQDQLATLLGGTANPAAIRVREWFRWLPAAGFLPLPGAGRRGIAHPVFWTGLTVRQPTAREPAIYLDGARLGELLAAALAQPPIDVESGEVVWTYRVRQNHPLPATGESEPPYMVFTSGHLPFLGTARFDLARWNRSNFGLL
jgi:hypothetical protein